MFGRPIIDTGALPRCVPDYPDRGGDSRFRFQRIKIAGTVGRRISIFNQNRLPAGSDNEYDVANA